jgi:uncharacterized protein YjfI (DUF2170 family)
MKAKPSAHYQREFRRRLRDQGLVKKEVWILPQHAGRLVEFEKQLRISQPLSSARGAKGMAENDVKWTTASLFDALQRAAPIASGDVSVELIDGIEPALHIVMNEYGDLPVFLTVSGDQIIVEAVLWSTREIRDIHGFNEAILRTHKYFPLSNISLDSLGESGDYYHMFGALSAASSLANVIFEIETLAGNVIHATDAYAEFLDLSVAAI